MSYETICLNVAQGLIPDRLSQILQLQEEPYFQERFFYCL